MQQPSTPPAKEQTLLPVQTARTQRDLEALVLNRSELVHQREMVKSMRDELTQQLRGAEVGAQRNLQGRLRALDQRSDRLEQDILRADDAIANALARGVAAETPRPGTTIQVQNPGRGDVIANIMLFNGLAFVVLAIVLYRWTWNRAKAKFAGSSPDASSGAVQSRRLDQLQHAVDTIAVEVERISEGQRYVTKLLTDRQLGAGAAQEIMPKRGSAEAVRAAGERDDR